MDLFDAAKHGLLEQVMLLVVQGAEKDKTFGHRQETALAIAAEHGLLDIIRYLVEQGADMEKADSYGWTPLFTAACSGHLEEVRYLLEQGANRDKVDTDGDSPSRCCCQRSAGDSQAAHGLRGGFECEDRKR